MLEHQNKLIQEMTDNMKNTEIDDEKRNALPHYLSAKDEQVKNDHLHQNIGEKLINFKELYMEVKNKNYDMEDDANNHISDNDSFITINTSDEESDFTLDASESSDSGIIDTFGSYGVNPMFSKGVEDKTSITSRVCKEFVFIRQNKEKCKSQTPEADDKVDAQGTKSLDNSLTASIKHSQRKIVILQDDSAMIVNESCLI